MATLGRIRRDHAINSIADFIAARYGKSGTLAAWVTILAVIAIVPYLALQLRAIALSSDVLLQHSSQAISTSNMVLMLTGLLALLAMIFGTRQIAHTEQHGGLMLAVAFESVVKLFALLAVAGFFLWQSPQHALQVQQDVAASLQQVQIFGLPDTFWTQTLLAALAMICLPRQFHVAVVELRDEQHLSGARFCFAAYLVLTTLAIIPIASWALHAAPQWMVLPDVAVLSLPLSYGQSGLGLLAFLGGFSAATGMLLVATLALSIMLSNDLIMPALWRMGWISPHDPRLPELLKLTRRICILLVMTLGFLFFQGFSDIEQLSVFGLLAFSAVAQFAPALIGGLYWRGGSRAGVYAGLLSGFALWFYTLLWPTLLRSLPLAYQPWAQQLLQDGPWQLYGLRPEALFGFAALPSLSHGVLWSLGSNVLLFIAVSRRFRPSVAEQIQAENFFYYQNQSMDGAAPATLLDVNQPDISRLKIADLLALAQRITGERAAQHAFERFSLQQQIAFAPNHLANGLWWRFTEQYLAGSIGAASARTLLTTALLNNGLALGQVANLLDQASQWQRFNQNLLMTMINHMTQGVSVVDARLCLVAWNQQYLTLFDYPTDLVYVGCPVTDLIRYNAERGECGPGEIEAHVQKRLQWMQMGNPHEFERIRKDGRVIQMRGTPILGGGFVTTFADISAFRANEAMLEARVSERTQQLADALAQQQQAREQADLANLSKSRFIAAASHDLLQPMHAARLFSSALEHSAMQHSALTAADYQSLQQLDRALHGAESMLSALLDIARLEGDAAQPSRQPYPLRDLLTDLQLQFQSIAARRQLQLHIHVTDVWIDTDPQWMRRMVQNLLSNALRYTATGRVVVGVLRSASRAGQIRLGVWDTGPGIAPHQQQRLFQEFERGGHRSPWGEQGLGLGLSIVQRMAQRLSYPLTLYSRLGKGACFMLQLPTCAAPQQGQTAPSATTVNLVDAHANGHTTHHPKLKPLSVLCLDNDAQILTGMQTLLHKWGYAVYCASEPEQALALMTEHEIEVWLIDQHLNQGQLGSDFIAAYRQRQDVAPMAVALISADSDPNLPERAKQANCVLLKKPLKPAALRAWLAGIKRPHSQHEPEVLQKP